MRLVFIPLLATLPVLAVLGEDSTSPTDRGSTHWSFRPVRRPIPPPVQNVAWVRTPVDRFVLARLEAVGIAPASTTDRRTLIRRVTLDLTGLLPSPDAVDSFVSDRAPDAFERVVDRLLTSPAYAERWGRHWLDVARYGDCNGADESRAFPNAYHYRNWVIDSFQRDKPYSQFVTEQIAGDLLPADAAGDDTYDPVVGTGFLVIGTKILAERDQEKMLVDTIDEQLDTLGRAFLGLTVGCARCHDHKFDPIPTSEYYALAGILRSTRTMASPGQWLERDAYTSATRAALQDWDTRSAPKIASVNETLAKLESRRIDSVDSAAVRELEAETFSRGNATIDTENYGKGIGIVSDPGAQKNFVEYDVDVPRDGTYVVQFRYAAAQSRPVRLLFGERVVSERAAAQVTGSWMPDGQRWFTEGELDLRAGSHVLRFENEGCLPHFDKIRIVDRARAGDYFDLEKRIAELTERRDALVASKPSPIRVMAVEDDATVDMRVHVRGSHLKLGDQVPRGFIGALKAPQSELPANASGRLELARWINSPGNPLTARVFVNRVWRNHFGRGLVTTPNNFGARGRAPSHSKLLDWLASRFVEEGTSIKKLHREIVLSSTYRMAWRHGDETTARVDPDNALRWRYGTRRLEAEAIRDAFLQVTERLDRTVGGAPLTLETYDLPASEIARNRQFYEDSRRRTVYLPVLRTNLYEFLTLFDFANPDLSTGRRSETNVPTQSLFLLNNRFVTKTAERLAMLALEGSPGNSEATDGSDDSHRLRALWPRLFARPATDEELARTRRFLREYAATTRGVDVDTPPETPPVTARREAWNALCQALLISSEFVSIR